MGWKEDLPAAVQEWDEVKNAETPEALFNQIADLRSTVGQSVRIPGEDASDETRQQFYTKLIEKVPGLIRLPGDDDEDGQKNLFKQLGAPDTIEGYKVEADDSLVTALKETALKSRLTKKQFKEIADKLLATKTEAKTAKQEKLEADIAGLKLKWGQAYDDKIAKVELVRKQYFPFAPEGVALGAETIEAFAKLGDQLAGESQGLQTSGAPQGALTPAEALTKISEIMSNKDHPYWNRRDPAHALAREKMSKLNTMAYPG